LSHLQTPPVIWMVSLQAQKRMRVSKESKSTCKILYFLLICFSLQEMFEKRRRRRESHNAVERRRRDNINERIHGNVLDHHHHYYFLLILY
jgi:hypothetical protein